MNQSRLQYSTNKHRLELGNVMLYDGDLLEICVVGHWIVGQVACDSTGWYLMTRDHIGIRLQAGVLARRPHGDFLPESHANGHRMHH